MRMTLETCKVSKQSFKHLIYRSNATSISLSLNPGPSYGAPCSPTIQGRAAPCNNFYTHCTSYSDSIRQPLQPTHNGNCQ